MSNGEKEPEDFDEEELIRSEFESIVSRLSLDESGPRTYLDDLEKIDTDNFVPPNPPRQTPRGFIASAQRAINHWFNRDNRDDDGATV